MNDERSAKCRIAGEEGAKASYPRGNTSHDTMGVSSSCCLRDPALQPRLAGWAMTARGSHGQRGQWPGDGRENLLSALGGVRVFLGRSVRFVEGRGNARVANVSICTSCSDRWLR